MIVLFEKRLTKQQIIDAILVLSKLLEPGTNITKEAAEAINSKIQILINKL